MNETAANFLKLQLRDVLIAAFNDSDFADFIRVNVARTDFDFDNLPGAWGYQRKVWEAINWAEQYGDLKQVLWLAEQAEAKRPAREDLKRRIADLRILVNGTALPNELAKTLALARTMSTPLWDLAVQLRSVLRSQTFAEYDLPGRFHLSDALEERMVCVLALEVAPSVNYIRWLAERITVEGPLLGSLAAKALIGSARSLDRTALPRVKSAIEVSLAQLKDSRYADDPPNIAPFPVNARAREYLVRVADTLIDVRDGAGLLSMPPTDVDRFFTALVQAFDRAAFSEMCAQKLGGIDKFTAHAGDPVELVIAHVVIQARHVGKVPNLLWAACDTRPADATLKELCGKFGGPRPAAI